MKNICILLFTLASLNAMCAIDPAPENAKFELDSSIIKEGAYISLIDNQTDYKHDRTQIIRSENDYYYFIFPGKTFRIKVMFKDSMERYTPVISNKSRYSIFRVNLNSEKNLTITDITSHVKNNLLLKFIFFAILLFNIIKILPTIVIFFPKDSLTFLKYYGSAQLIYSIVFSFLIFFFHGKGLLISIIVFLIALIIDNRLLKRMYFNTNKAGRISLSIILSSALTIIFVFLLLFVFVMMI